MPLVDDKTLDHLCSIYWNLNDIAMELIEGWRDLQRPLDGCVDLIVLTSWQRRCQTIAVHIQTTIEFLTLFSDTRIPERTDSGWLDRFESIAKRIVRMKPWVSLLAKECEERMVSRHERTGLKQGRGELNRISSTLSNIKYLTKAEVSSKQKAVNKE